MSRAFIFINSPLENPGAARAFIQPSDTILAADGGARLALALGLVPQVILGDLDSLTEVEARVLEDMGVHILRYPVAKDKTDLELALNHAIQADYSPIIVMGGYTGRIDQTIANLTLLSSPEAIHAGARLDDGITESFFIASSGIIYGQPGDLISLIPWGLPAEGILTDGLAYPLNRETLFPCRARGISNQMLGHTASVHVEKGLLLCIHQRKR